MREELSAGGHAALLLAALGGLVFVTGQPFLFPSLGPTAYLLAVQPDAPTTRPRRVLGGHAVGVVAGLLAYTLLAAPLVGTQPPPATSVGAIRLAASAAVSVGVTTAGMLAVDLQHAPACATTLIVGLGLLASPVDAVVILVAVAVLLVADRAATAARSSLAGGTPA